MCTLFFCFNDTATTEIYTLSLHDALPISLEAGDPSVTYDDKYRYAVSVGRVYKANLPAQVDVVTSTSGAMCGIRLQPGVDRKSTRLNSSHANISYAVFCLKKKTKNNAYST